MSFEEFEVYTQELLKKVHEMKRTKGKEYAGDKDRFDNFNRLGVKCGGMDRKLVWLVYFTKHMDAIESYIKSGREFSTESIEGRIVDAITYLTLLAGMIKEEKKMHKEANRILETANIQDCTCIKKGMRTCPIHANDTEGTLHVPLKGTL